jgi:polar amino acid transport system substrate-binding protein
VHTKILLHAARARTYLATGLRRAAGCGAIVLSLALLGAPAAAWGQTAAPPAPAAGAAPPVTVPSFWDPKRRQEKPELPSGTVIRFLTETDFPPFNYAGPDGNPAGFNVDLARMLCEELRVACTIQMRRFDTLLESLAQNRGDAVIASIAATPETRAQADFSDPYYRSPARFVARKDSKIVDPLPETLEGIRIAAVAGTAHEAYAKAFFSGADLRAYPDADAARQALRAGEVELLFGDATQLAFWLNGSSSEGCCSFRGGPYLESRYFGDGIGIAVRPGNDVLRRALNWGLFQLWQKSRYTELWLRHFPISPY